jgi:cold-inducible RNA-binding protein
MDRMTARPRGFAFIEFGSDEEADKAIELFNDHELEGRTLRVNKAEERAPRPRSFGGPPSFDGGGGGGGGGSRPGGGGGGGGKPRGGIGKPKGSRRNLRAKKRSL